MFTNAYTTSFSYGKHPYEVCPELAAELPEVSPDGLTIIIKLRKGIHFYDPTKKLFPDGIGPELTAADVLYSFKQLHLQHLVREPELLGRLPGCHRRR